MKILLIWFLLIVFWILAVYSVSIHQSFTLTLSKLWDPTNYFYFIRHLRSIAIAIVAALFVYRIPISFFKKQANIMIITAVVFLLQILVFVPWIWIELNWARWRLNIPLLPSMQPSEFFKLWYVFFMSGWLIRKRKNIYDEKQLILSFVIINIAFLFIFLLIPDFWSALVMWITWLIMAIYSWINWRKILLLFILWIAWILLFWTIASNISDRFAYIQKRMTYFISSPNDEDSRWIGWQNEQALNAIGGWGLFGKWYWKWLQKFWYIPEAQSDFIFAAFSEEIWFVWDMFLLGLYFYLLYYVLWKLVYIRDEYSKMIAVWILSLIMTQAFINIWVNLKILPNTWLTLPFLSHGWTAIMVNMISLILLYKIIKNK